MVSISATPFWIAIPLIVCRVLYRNADQAEPESASSLACFPVSGSDIPTGSDCWFGHSSAQNFYTKSLLHHSFSEGSYSYILFPDDNGALYEPASL